MSGISKKEEGTILKKDWANDEFFMLEALKLAELAYSKEEVPIGAVITYENRIIARGYNQVETLADPTAHAEMIAITSATSYFKFKWLKDCTIYVTIEPCMMCAKAIILARIKRVVWGAADSKTGAFGSLIDINSLRLNHKVDVEKGILKDRCSDIITSFFNDKRKRMKPEDTN